VVREVGAESFEVLEILCGAAMESFGLGLVAEENGDDVGLPVQAADTLAGPIGAEIRAVCGNSARTDLCGGCWVTGIPTATVEAIGDAAHGGEGLSFGILGVSDRA
jgi:hypothetical protein